jgi:hypothetical protein
VNARLTGAPAQPLGNPQSRFQSRPLGFHDLAKFFADSAAGLIVPFVIGWIADFLRLAWSLLDWNTRKTLWQRRGWGGRASCQNPSASSRAAESQGEACLHWKRPAGLSCSVNAPDVRSLRVLVSRYFGGTYLALYFIGVLGVFVFLSTVGYPSGVVHGVWPGLCHRVPEARGAFIDETCIRAMYAGRIKEALLNFDTAHRLDPESESSDLTVACNDQAAHPALTDSRYARLDQEPVGQRSAAAQHWCALLNRPEASFWHPFIRSELQLPEQPAFGQFALLERGPLSAPSFSHDRPDEVRFEIGGTFSVLDRLVREAGRGDDESSLVLRFGALARTQHGLQLAHESRIRPIRPFAPALVKTLSVHLIPYPHPRIARLLKERVQRVKLALDNANAGRFFSLLCMVGGNGRRASVAG